MLKSLFDKVAGFEAFRSATLLKRDFNTGVFLWILQNFIRTPTWKNICEWLLLHTAYFSTFPANDILKCFDESCLPIILFRQSPRAYLEPCQTSMMELFEKIFSKKSSTTDVSRDPEYASEILDSLKAVILWNSSRTTTLQMKSIPFTLQYLRMS